MNSLTSRPGTEPEAFTTGEPMIRLRNLEKCFQTKAGFTYVFRQINLDLAEGDFVSIMGPSGAGKSTLLGVLGLYDHVWEGECHLLDHPVHRLSPKERATLNKRYVGFVFQQFHLLDDLTVAENLDLPLSYRNIPKSERQGAVADVLDRFGIVGKKDLFPTQLSGGSNNLWPWLAPSLPNPSSFWPTSRLAIFTPIKAARSWSYLKSSISRAQPSCK
jgi:putative ABC transport system ATP-binding protein